MVRTLLMAAPLLLAGACDQASGTRGTGTPEGDIGPRTVAVDLERYADVRHVSAATGSDESGDGSPAAPWNTIGRALEGIADAGPEKRVAVLVAEGVYGDTTLVLQEHVDLYGGFEASGWTRDIFDHPTVLDGEGLRRIALGADDSTLDGFVLRNGSVRGKGGALLLDGISPIVSNNVFLENTTTPPDPWNPPQWHETAHDGGAIACLGGCSATIENNLFVRNTTEIGRGASFACDNEATRDRRAEPSVVANVFLDNVASAGADTMRSGDGGAISYYGYCDGVIADNVVAENEAANRNDGGGIFVALWSAPEIARNVIVGNRSGDDAGGLFLGGQKHHYGTPIDPVPPAEEFFVRVRENVIMGNESGTPTSGAFRATMMSRGAFHNNITAENPGGVYTQRSELALVHNTFAEDARNEDEERTAPGPTVYRNNIILGERNWGAPVTEEGTCTEDPAFVDDGFELGPAEVAYDPERHVTRLGIEAAGHPPGSLAGRVVQAGERWGVVRSNDEDGIAVWGDFGGQAAFAIKPTYHLAPGSLCIDRGVETEAPDRDIDGDPRPLAGGYDIGADEVRGVSR